MTVCTPNYEPSHNNQCEPHEPLLNMYQIQNILLRTDEPNLVHNCTYSLNMFCGYDNQTSYNVIYW